MVRHIVVLGGSSHPQLNDKINSHLGIPPSSILLSKFSVGETRVEIKESVRGKDVYIVQSGCGSVNDHFMELLIMISACKTASAKKVTAVMPLFPYSRQTDRPDNKAGAPLTRASTISSRAGGADQYTFESRPQTPHPNQPESVGLNGGLEGLHKTFAKTRLGNDGGNSPTSPLATHNKLRLGGNNGIGVLPKRSNTLDSITSDARTGSGSATGEDGTASNTSKAPASPAIVKQPNPTIPFQPQPGYKPWVAQAGTLIADLLSCAGADHIITMDLHDAQYQGFFDIPVDNLYARPLLKKYIQYNIPDYKDAVIVSPDAGGAKRSTAIADGLGMDFALIHKERRPTQTTERQNASMMLVGDVAHRTAILIDDLADTANTITRAAKLLKKSGATRVIALLTHGVFSGDAIDRINASALDKVVVTNSVPQHEHQQRCPKLEVLDVGTVFAEMRKKKEK
ncbi:MAG: hypothetical protein M1823_003138 [Watsoniomyces obsoletus]|nr:MAG: hypothetical protein M1823_003138 [Watsoniomyces obsoletus]